MKIKTKNINGTNINCKINTVDFPLDYQRVSSITFNGGNQYIDTNYILTTASKIELTVGYAPLVRSPNLNTQSQVNLGWFGTSKYSLKFIENNEQSDDLILRGQLSVKWDATTYTNTEAPNLLYLANTYTITFDAYNARVLINNNVEISPDGFINDTNTAYIGRINAPAVNSTDKFILYGCKIYDNNRLSHDFIPCYKKSDGKIGLFDRLTQQFHPSTGTDNLITGTNIATEILHCSSKTPASITYHTYRNTINGPDKIALGMTEVSSTAFPIRISSNSNCVVADQTDIADGIVTYKSTATRARTAGKVGDALYYQSESNSAYLYPDKVNPKNIDVYIYSYRQYPDITFNNTGATKTIRNPEIASPAFLDSGYDVETISIYLKSGYNLSNSTAITNLANAFRITNVSGSAPSDKIVTGVYPVTTNDDYSGGVYYNLRLNYPMNKSLPAPFNLIKECSTESFNFSPTIYATPGAEIRSTTWTFKDQLDQSVFRSWMNYGSRTWTCNFTVDAVNYTGIKLESSSAAKSADRYSLYYIDTGGNAFLAYQYAAAYNSTPASSSWRLGKTLSFTSVASNNATQLCAFLQFFCASF